MEFVDLENQYDDFIQTLDDDRHIDTNKNWCHNCDIQYETIDQILVCCMCGETDLDYPYVIENNYIYKLKRSIYKRKQYLALKIKMLNGVSIINNRIEYDKALGLLRTHKKKITTIQKLLKYIKKLKLNQFIVHIYSIYFDLFGFKLIKLNHNDIRFILCEFFKLEQFFKLKQSGLKRKKIYSYNVLLYMIFKKYYKHYCKFILLPYNYIDIMNSIIY